MFISNSNFLDSATLTASNEQTPYEATNIQHVHRSKVYKPSMTPSDPEVYSVTDTSIGIITLYDYQSTTAVDVIFADDWVSDGSAVSRAVFDVARQSGTVHKVRCVYATGATPTSFTVISDWVDISAYTFNVLTEVEINFSSNLETTSGTTYWFGLEFDGDTVDSSTVGVGYANTDTNSTGIRRVKGDSTYGFLTPFRMPMRLYFDGYDTNNLVIDLGSAQNPTLFAAIANRNETFMENVATITLEGNSADSWGSPAVSYSITREDEGIFKYDSTGFGSYRYWRLVVAYSSPPSAGDEFQIGNVFLGSTLTEPSQGVLNKIGLNTLTNSTPFVAQNGNVWTRQKQYRNEFICNFSNLTIAEKETLETLWYDKGVITPFYIGLDERDGVLGSSKTDSRFYVRFSASPTFDLVAPSVFESSWSLKEEL